MAEKIIDKNVLDEYKSNMTRYAIYVTRRRAMPDYRDGLKPSQRRILYCMYEFNKAISNTIKTSSVIGRCMEVLHPHGDQSLNATIKNMVNWFETNIPLIQGQGNWGDFSGSPQGAPRYTECKLSKFSLDAVLKDLGESKQVVDWVETFDNKNLEPEFLPVAIPLLLIEGSFGIAVGARTDIPAHNINEVIDATIALIHDENAPICLVPDTCMPCEIFRTNFKEINNKGFGSYKVRGIIDIEEYKGKTALVIKSVPDLTFLDSIIEKIEELVSTNKIIQIQDTFEESDVDNMRYVIVLKKGADPNYVKEVIYKNTNMEQTCRINFEVLDGIHPLRMSYRSYLLAFIEFRKDTKFRMYCNKLQKVQTKIHERDAYIKVLQSGEIDNIISMIKNQTNTDDEYVTEYLIKKLKITDLQAKFILNSNIKRLSLGYLNQYLQEAKELEQIKDEYMRKIVDKNAIVEEIIAELEYYKKAYGKPRNSKIIASKEAADIPAGEFKVIITENNFIKKIPINDSIGSFRGDNPKRIIKVDNRENILLFDVAGRVFKLPVHKIPFTDKNSNGTDIRILIKGCTSDINTVMYEPIVKELAEKLNKYYMVTITTNGNVKKMDLEDFVTIPPSGIIFIKVDSGETVQDVMIVNNKTDVIIYSDKEALRINTNSIPHFKRNARGSRSILTQNKIDGMSIIKHDTTDIVVITNKGYINRFDVVAMPTLDRGMQGSKVIKLSKDDSIHTIYGVNSNDTIRILTKNGRLEIPVSEIETGSSISPGQKMISTKGDVIIRCDIVKGKE